MEEDIFSVDADLIALKELEETLKENPDKEWLEYDGRKWIKEDYVVLKSRVKDKIEELKKKVEELTDEKGYWGGSDLLEQIKVLQELLEKEQ